jgi:glycosyltransferase involved in cell wall biosynthesis
MNLAHSRGVTNVRFIDQQPHDKVPAYIAASDVALVLLRKSALFKTVIPTKMLECMSCARPVILGVDGQARKILDEAQAGIFVEPENAVVLGNSVRTLAANPELCDLLGRNGRKYIVERFSRQQTAKAYISLLENLQRKQPQYPAWA